MLTYSWSKVIQREGEDGGATRASHLRITCGEVWAGCCSLLIAEPGMRTDAALHSGGLPVHGLPDVPPEAGSLTGAAPCPQASCQVVQNLQRAVCASPLHDAGLPTFVAAGLGGHGLRRLHRCCLECLLDAAAGGSVLEVMQPQSLACHPSQCDQHGQHAAAAAAAVAGMPPVMSMPLIHDLEVLD